jgi:hypothetical protein
VAAGLPIVDIQIDPREVFDPENPSERHRVFAWANALHVRTRDRVVQRELLFAAGDAFDPRRAAESERNLRALGIFQDAIVHVDTLAAGVRIRIETVDRWTTELRTEISRRGGINRVTLGLEEGNLMGTAIRIGGAVQTSNDIDATTFTWSDPRTLGTRWAARYGLRYDDLGRSQVGTLQRGFYSETVLWTAGVEMDLNRGDRRQFDAGEEIDRLEIRRIAARAASRCIAAARSSSVARYGRTPQVRGIEDDLAILDSPGHVYSASSAPCAMSIDSVSPRTSRAVGRCGGCGADLRARCRLRSTVPARDLGWAHFLGTRGLCGLQLRQRFCARAA